jgi:hypothetical protein
VLKVMLFRLSTHADMNAPAQRDAARVSLTTGILPSCQCRVLIEIKIAPR